ncbi:hypothetical protein MXD62_07075 [Frankia sp. Mgl5]|uniref:hypothetical protein n=1 Tax=Frankia sp. Mgl5 TaxID=2933793 RepID=UPI00200D00D8|nr:hypothetical protein [Frankia sp. Mgl5]MCK9926930.1 hypothetical protein [Frankia sp. Mgl5]
MTGEAGSAAAGHSDSAGPGDAANRRAEHSDTAGPNEDLPRAEKSATPDETSTEPAEKDDQKKQSERIDDSIEAQLRLREQAAQGRNSIDGRLAATFAAEDLRNLGSITVGDDAVTVGPNNGVININSDSRRQLFGLNVTRQRILSLREVFVSTTLATGETSLDCLVNLLKKNFAAALSGPAGSGRTALSLLALDAVSPGNSIIQLDHRTNPSDLHAEDLKSGHGYVLDGASFHPDHTEQVIDHLRSITAKINAHFILILTSEADFETQFQAPDGISLHLMPDRIKVFRKHASARLRAYNQAASVGEMKQDLRDAVAAADMKAIAKISERAAHALLEEKDVGEYLHEQAVLTAASRLAEPVENTTEDGVRHYEARRLFRRAFLLALAVFNETRVEIVTEAARDLATRLCLGHPLQSRTGRAFSEDTATLLSWAQATIVLTDDPELSPPGTPGEPAGADNSEKPASPHVRFRDPAMAGAVLEAFWLEHHLARKDVLEWLTESTAAVDENFDDTLIRMRSAQALGYLARFDFELVTTQYINRWVEYGRVWSLRSAAWAVEMMVDNTQTADDAWRLVREWSQGARTSRQAALRVYSTELGGRRTTEALDFVSREVRLPESTGGRAAAAVVYAVAAAGGIDEVWSLLSSWVSRIDRFHTIAAQRDVEGVRLRAAIPVHAVRTLLLLTGDRGPESVSARLIQRTGRGSEDHEILLKLWKLALTMPGLSGRAWRTLRSWLENLDEYDDELGTSWSVAADRLIGDLAKDRTIRRRLLFNSRQWRNEWSDTRPRAQEILGRALTTGAAQ